MKFDINNPAFLQAACAGVTSLLVARSTSEDVIVFEFNIGISEGDVLVVTRVMDGATTTYSEVVPSSGYFEILADAGTDVFVRGNILSITDEKGEGHYDSLSYLDISKCRTLQKVSGMEDTRLTEIKTRATQEEVATGISAAIDTAENKGTVYIKQGDPYNEQIRLAAQRNDWEVIEF